MGSIATETNWAWLREVEDAERLIVLAYSKDDTDEMVVDIDSDGTDILAELTDEEWERVRHRFDKAADHIREQCWALIEDIAREERGKRPAKAEGRAIR